MTRMIKIFPLFLLLTGLITGSCTKDKAPVGKQNLSLLDYIAQDSSLSLFHAALLRAKIDTFFAGGGPFTIFAPGNNALLQAGLTGEKIGAYDPAALSSVMTYYILPGKLSSAELVGFSSSFPVSLNKNFKPNVSKNYYGIFFNGNHVTEGNIQLADGVVHKLNSFSFLPTDSLLTVLGKQADCTLFTAALKRCRPLVALLRKNDSVTLFVPNDDAFRAFGYRDTVQINQADSIGLTKLLNTYIGAKLLGRLYTSDLIGGKAFRSNDLHLPYPPPNDWVYSVRYNISLDGTQIIPYSNPYNPGTPTGILIPPRLLRTNILSIKGVIHTVDQVFIP